MPGPSESFCDRRVAGKRSIVGPEPCATTPFCLARAMSHATSEGRSSFGRYSDSGTPSALAARVNFSACATSPVSNALRGSQVSFRLLFWFSSERRGWSMGDVRVVVLWGQRGQRISAVVLVARAWRKGRDRCGRVPIGLVRRQQTAVRRSRCAGVIRHVLAGGLCRGIFETARSNRHIAGALVERHLVTVRRGGVAASRVVRKRIRRNRQPIGAGGVLAVAE